MKIKIASKNPTKVKALKEIILDYEELKNAEVISESFFSGVEEQPKSLEETIQGAMNRSRNVYNDCEYSFGIESGIMKVPHTKSGYMDVCACAIYDGKEYHLGLSSAWEPPKEIIDYIINEGLDMSQAALKANITTHPKVGTAEGLIGILTEGKLTRKDYTKEAIRTALIKLGV